MADYENIVNNELTFPVDAFIQDNKKEQIKVKEHWHDCFEILYMLVGDARQKINQHSFVAKQGEIIVIKNGDIHSTYCEAGEETKILVLKFMPSVVDIRYSRLDGSKYIAAFLNKANETELLSLEANLQEEIKNLLIKILDEFVNKPKAYDLRIKGTVFELIALLVRYDVISIPEHTAKEYDLERMATVIAYIEDHYTDNLTLSEIAEILHMNYTYVSKYFKKITGTSFKAYLDYVRISEAEKMIVAKSCYIYQIAVLCGFSSVQAFNRAYKRMKGYSPKELKR